MRILLFIIIVTTVIGCSQEKQFITITKGSVTLLVQDTSDYSQEYIDELLNWDLTDTYTLNHDSLIVGGGFGYGLFDTILLKGKQYNFQSSNINLGVKRINFSTIEYEIQIKSGNEFKTFRGLAHGGVSVFGSETDEDDKTRNSYFCSEYSNNWKHSTVIVRIDSENGDKAKIIVNGDLSIPLDKCPTLSLRN